MDPVKTALTRDLTKAGYNSRMVSVKRRHYGAYTLTIRSTDVNIEAVRTIADEHERYSRDERTGDILMGGNIFITVEVMESIKSTHAQPFTQAVYEAEKALKAMAPFIPAVRNKSLLDNHSIRIGDSDFFMMLDGPNYKVISPGHSCLAFYSLFDIAFFVATKGVRF